jgi:hypothetical protein
MVFVLSTILQFDYTREPNGSEQGQSNRRITKKGTNSQSANDTTRKKGSVIESGQLTRSLPSRQVSPPRRKADFYYIRQIELAKQLSPLC